MSSYQQHYYQDYANDDDSEDTDDCEEESEITEYLSSHSHQSQPHYAEPTSPDQMYEPLESSSSIPRYQPGQALAPILTGETLNIDDIRSSPHSSSDPFSGSPTDYAGQPSYYPDQDYVPPFTLTDTYSSAFTAGTGAAYASGYLTRASYVPPRSRSPTPAVDDEDYHVVGDESYHYTGESQDPEKGEYVDAYHGQPDYPTEYDSHYPVQMSKQESIYSAVSESDSTPVETRHFGTAPKGRTERRHLKRTVALKNGHLVTDLPIPPKLVLPWRGSPETLHTRYSAVTCDPDDFARSGYSLRQFELKRTTEIFIVITMYNEDEVLFCRTLYGVMRNISQLCARKNSKTWGRNGWQKVVVCIVADGRKKIHPRVLDCLTLLGVYQEVPKDITGLRKGFNVDMVSAHLYEYTTSFGLDPNLHFKYPDKGIVPTQIIFCMKEKNQKKINSHRWFFNAFAPLLQPKVCVLLDVGTCPGSNSIYRLWKTFDLNSNVGGACGEIAAFKGKRWSLLLNPLVAAQNFEYKNSSILDKPTESMFGYISVLPGAFSAYRYFALQNENGVGPLASYFKGEVLHGRDTDIFTSNMYLAEDRILCFELVAKAKSNWVLRYVKGAIGETDVPDALPEFMSQRRRWLNGSFFAATYAIAHTPQIWRSGHSLSRKICLTIETMYNIMNLIFSWFSIGNFYLFFVVLTSSLEDSAFGVSGIKYLNWFAQYFLASIIISLFFMSMSIKPQTAKWKYKTLSIALCVCMIYMLTASVVCALKAYSQGGSANIIMLFSVIITFGIYAISSVIALDPSHMLTSFLPYMLLSPTYINILQIYAFSNLDDISWGTKQDAEVEPEGTVVRPTASQVDLDFYTEASTNELYEEAIANLKNRTPVVKPKSTSLSEHEKAQAAKEYYASIRTNVLLTWVLTNGILLALILGSGSNTTTTFSEGYTRAKTYLTFILVLTTLANSIRFVASTIYLLITLITG